MKMRYSVLFLVLCACFGSCKDDEYAVDYDKKKIELAYVDGRLVFRNNLDVPVVLDNFQKNRKEAASFIRYRVCDYVKYKQEVVVDYREKVNQIISLESILMPKKEKVLAEKLVRGDRIRVEFYPVQPLFLADNVYFFEKQIKPDELKYRLYPETNVKALNMAFTGTNRSGMSEISGIMIYVKEYEQLSDNLEKKEFEL